VRHVGHLPRMLLNVKVMAALEFERLLAL